MPSKSILALLKKSKWQIQHMNLEIQQLSKEHTNLSTRYDVLEQQFIESSPSLKRIVPELETLHSQYRQTLYRQRDELRIQLEQLTQLLTKKKADLLKHEIKIKLQEQLLEQKLKQRQQAMQHLEELQLETLILARPRNQA